MKQIHDFEKQLAFSEGIELDTGVLERIAGIVPNATVIRRATVNEDKHGTDYWIDRTHGLPSISIDVKHRSFCPIEKFGSDDACIETTSVYHGSDDGNWIDEHRDKPGWTVDYRKRTDWIVYTWPADGGTRFWIVPFTPLCKASRLQWREWAKEYKERSARNNGYVTLSIYPPRKVIARSMKTLMSGTVWLSG